MPSSRILGLTIAIGILSGSVQGQEWAKQQLEKSPRHREWVTVKHDGRSVETYVVYPESKNKTSVVVLIHEIFGMSDWVQEVADEVAAAGYIAVAPDLLSGVGPNGKGTSSIPSQDVGKAIRDLPPDQITADLQAVADYGLKLPAAAQRMYCGRFLLGWRTDLSLRDKPPGPSSSIRFLWTSSDERRERCRQSRARQD